MITSQGRIKTWRHCHRAYHYRYVEGLERKKPELPPLRGTIIHECLDALVLQPKSWKDVISKYEKQYAKLFDEEKEIFGDLPKEVERIVENYQRHYANDTLKYLKGPDGNKVEIEVTAELAKGITFRGHLDKLPKDSEGRVWVMDHKTHQSIPDENARFSDLQTVVYSILLPRAGGPEPDGVLWDYIRTKPPTPPEQLKNGQLTRRKNLDCDYDTFMGEINRFNLDPADYQEELERCKENENRFFQRVFLPKPNSTMIKTITDDLVATAKEINEDKTRNMSKNCSYCEFFTLCHSELRGLDTKFLRKAEYREVDPQERR